MRSLPRRRFLQQSACFSLLALNAAPSALAAAGREPSPWALRLIIHLINDKAKSSGTTSDTKDSFLRMMYWNDWHRTIVLPPNPTTIARHWSYPSCEDWYEGRPGTEYRMNDDKTTRDAFRQGIPTRLKPGQSVTFKLKTDVFKAAQTDQDFVGIIRDGLMSFRLQVRLWPDGEDPQSAVYDSWRRLGYLWTQDPVSLPLGNSHFP